MTPKQITLGVRLKAIASLIRKGSTLGDIGTDHAYLPVYLIQQKIIKQAIGIDIHEGPYQSAVQTVQNFGLQDFIDIRQGDGLIPLHPGEVDTLVIAGMGGNTMLQILYQRQDIMLGIKEMILQPQGAEGKLRRKLINDGWRIKTEIMIEEDERIYTLIYFTRDDGFDKIEIEQCISQILAKVKEMIGIEGYSRESCKDNNEIDEDKIEIDGETINEDILIRTIESLVWELGPRLIKHEISREVIKEQKNALLERLLIEQIQRLEKIASQMRHTVRKEVEERIKEINEEIKVWEMIKECLFQ